jgi:hypothetical protein
VEKKIFVLNKETAEKLSNEQLAEKLFSEDCRILGNLSEWVKDNGERYNTVRQIAQEGNRVGRIIRQQNVEDYGPKEPVFSSEQIKCRALHSREYCRAFMAGELSAITDRPDVVAKAQPARYRELKTAWDSYESPTMVPRRTDTFPISPKLAMDAHLPANLQINADEMAMIINAVHDAEKRNETK